MLNLLTSNLHASLDDLRAQQAFSRASAVAQERLVELFLSKGALLDEIATRRQVESIEEADVAGGGGERDAAAVDGDEGLALSERFETASMVSGMSRVSHYVALLRGKGQLKARLAAVHAVIPEEFEGETLFERVSLLVADWQDYRANVPNLTEIHALIPDRILREGKLYERVAALAARYAADVERLSVASPSVGLPVRLRDVTSPPAPSQAKGDEEARDTEVPVLGTPVARGIPLAGMVNADDDKALVKPSVLPTEAKPDDSYSKGFWFTAGAAAGTAVTFVVVEFGPTIIKGIMKALNDRK